MKIGLVKHLNARPLTYGLEKSNNHELVYDNPSILVKDLLNQKLDLALISSVECLRNKNLLNWSLSTGVCARKRVRSILFFKNKKETHPINSINVDHGSRSSVALLKILYHSDYKIVPETIALPPGEIQRKIIDNEGSHLLFGDNALLANWDPKFYDVIDLAEWWNEITGKHFCFALWAYPKDLRIPDEIFYKSLEFGLTHIEEIIQSETRFPYWLTSRYLKEELHYILDEKDRSGFKLFEEKCSNLNLLS
ncbi:MAG: menaquinone biosynthesis protein [Leptospiraceae bacterium]|nr:menaquinone biosynthesis protein [Leptospiraceae bacterium]